MRKYPRVFETDLTPELPTIKVVNNIRSKEIKVYKEHEL